METGDGLKEVRRRMGRGHRLATFLYHGGLCLFAGALLSGCSICPEFGGRGAIGGAEDFWMRDHFSHPHPWRMELPQDYGLETQMPALYPLYPLRPR